MRPYRGGSFVGSRGASASLVVRPFLLAALLALVAVVRCVGLLQYFWDRWGKDLVLAVQFVCGRVAGGAGGRDRKSVV